MNERRVEGSTNGNTAQATAAGPSPADQQATALRRQWATDPRWRGTERSYTADDVVRLRGSVQEDQTLARLGAERLWALLHEEDFVAALGALTGNQAVQQVRAGLAGHLPVRLAGGRGRQPGRADLPGPEPVPGELGAPGGPADQQRAAARRPDRLGRGRRQLTRRYWLAPIVADAEAGFGGVLNAFELMKSMIAAGAAGVHWEDQLASEKKCGHLGGKVLIPTCAAHQDAQRRPAGRRRL